MGIENWIRLRAPKASQLDNLAQQKLKTVHPEKATRNWFHRTVLRFKKFQVWLTSFRSSLGSRIPGVQIRTRNVVTRNIDNFMTGKGVQAQSKTGVYLEPEDKKFAVEELGAGAIFEDDKLMELDKKALKKVEDQFDEINRQFTEFVVEYDRKEQTEQLTEEDVQKMDDLGALFRDARERYTRTTALAVKLDMSRMNEKLRSATSMQQLLKAQARAMALDPEDFSDSFIVARLNVASFDAAQRDIDRRSVELGQKYLEEVFDDVAPFVDDPNGAFAKLVDEQTRHNLIKGTGQLPKVIEGVRLPGLDWYVKRAKAQYRDNPDVADMDMLQKAASMMYKDWSLFHDQVQARVATIRQDWGDGKGAFNPSDMPAYHHAQSYMQTLKWLEELGGTDKEGRINKKALYDVSSDYGDDLGFGLRVDGPASDAAVLKKYGMTSFGQDYLESKFPKGVPEFTAQAPKTTNTVSVNRDVVKQQLQDEFVPTETLDSPPPPYSPGPQASNDQDVLLINLDDDDDKK